MKQVFWFRRVMQTKRKEKSLNIQKVLIFKATDQPLYGEIN